MQNFFKDCGKIDLLTYDKGKEFENNKFIKFCNDNNIKTFVVPEDSHKLGIVNRFHKTLKTKLKKIF